MGVIYKITNTINNKSYIGLTTRTVEKRWKEHLKVAHSPQSRDTNTIFYRAIRKYGNKNWNIEILDECEDEEELKEKEIYYIKKYNTYAFQENSQGYNSTFGGDGINNDLKCRAVVVVDPITFKAIERYPSIAAAQKVYGRGVQETCARKTVYHHYLIFYYEDEFNLLTQEELIKDVCSRINIYCQLDFNGNLINIFTNLTEYCRKNNFHQGNISTCIAGGRQTSDNFQWCLYQNLDQYLGKPYIKKPHKTKRVNQYTLDGTFIRQWDSIKEAADSLNKDGSHISGVCKGKRNIAYGYKWTYVKED